MRIKIILMTVLSLTSIIGVSEGQINDSEKSVSKSATSINYELIKHTISSGGGISSAGIYSVISSIGQIDAGHNASGGSYQFNGGLLAQSGNDLIFRNSFEF